MGGQGVKKQKNKKTKKQESIKANPAAPMAAAGCAFLRDCVKMRL